MDVIGNLQVRRKQFQLRALALFIKNLNGLLPARMGRTVQLSEIAKCALPGTIRRTYGLDQRPIAVACAVSHASVSAKEHLAPITRDAWDAVWMETGDEVKPLRQKERWPFPKFDDAFPDPLSYLLEIAFYERPFCFCKRVRREN